MIPGVLTPKSIYFYRVFNQFQINMVKKITVYGSGAFGFALTKHWGNKFLNNQEYDICLYDKDEEVMHHIIQTKKHPFHFPGAVLPQNIKFATEVETAVTGADIILLAVPSESIRDAIRHIKRFIKKESIILNVSKGLELKTNKRASEIIKETLNNQVATFSGGTIAEDIVNDSYLGAEIGCEDYKTASELADILTTERLKVYPNNDLIGVEYTGAFKNVISIAAGIADGLKVPYGSKTYLITQASDEAKKLSVKLGAKEHTFSSGSQSWSNDLWMSCTGNTRNKYFGELIGKGHKPKEALDILKSEHKIAEGFYAAHAVYQLLKKHDLCLPVLENVYHILYKGKDPKDLMSF